MGLFRILAGLDWITPAAGLVESVRRGELGSTFQCDDVGTCREAMERLHYEGIETWALGYDAWSDLWCFNVSDDDYQLACNILGVEEETDGYVLGDTRYVCAL